MTESIKGIINRINSFCDELEFGEARRIIELNLKPLSNLSYYRLLNENAKVILKHILKQASNKDYKPLTRLEYLKINNINTYCSEFDISMLKRTLKDSIDFIQRPDVNALLNSNAKTILESMGAIIAGSTEDIS